MSRKRRLGLLAAALAVSLAGAAAAVLSGVLGGQGWTDRLAPSLTGEAGSDAGTDVGQGGGVPDAGERQAPDGGADAVPGEAPAGIAGEVPIPLVYDLVDELTAAGTAPVRGRDLLVEYEGPHRDVIVMRGAFENTRETEIRFELRDGTWVRSGSE